jgi:hypothetical protein
VSQLKGAPQLKRRLTAIQRVRQVVGPMWADKATRYTKAATPSRTGKTRASIKARREKTRPRVVGSHVVRFIDAGSKAHDIEAKKVQALKFTAGSGPIFRRKVHKARIPARPYKRAAAERGLREVDVNAQVRNLWNQAA